MLKSHFFVNQIGDTDYQKNVWLKVENTTEQSSFTEVICGLYDDFNFDLYMQELSKHVTKQEVLSPIVEFKNSLDTLLNNIDTRGMADKDIISYRQWHEVRLLAIKASSSLNSINEEL